MGSRFVKRGLSLLLVLSLLLSMSVSAFAVDTTVSVMSVDSTQGTASVEFPTEWVEGRNTFDVTSPVPCVAFSVDESGAAERLDCAIVDETAGHYRFQHNASDGDTVYVAVKGDADLDGYVTVTDMTRISQSLVQLYPFSVANRWAADVDDDGQVTVTDMTRISQKLVTLYQWTWDIGWELGDEPEPPVITPSEDDWDGDGIPNDEDLDDDNDGIADVLDPDDNNDGILDVDDPTHPDYDPDTDGDGLRDSMDDDDDGDKIPDIYDPDHPDYIGPMPDPNEDATLTLSVDASEVHIGDDVIFTLANDIEGEYEVSWWLAKGAAGSTAIDTTVLTETGGSLVMDEAVGMYTMLAIAVTESGKSIESNAVSVNVTNNSPVVTDITFDLTYPDNTSGYVEEAKVRIDIDVNAGDPDGDEYTVHYIPGDGYVGASGTYLDEGDYTIGVYVEDKWGAKSEIKYCPVKVDALDTVPVIYTDKDVVHIGETFNVYVNVDVLEDKISRWALYDADGNQVDFDQSNMSKDGGTMCVEDGTGVYTLHAIGVDEYGVEFDMQTLSIGVENNRPGTVTISHEIIENDFEKPFTSDAKIFVDFTFAGSDPDGDDTTVYVVNASGEDYVPTDGYYAQGTYEMRLYCVDEWGLVGDVITYQFTVDNQVPHEPNIMIDVDYSDWKYINDVLCVNVTITADGSDPDRDDVRVQYEDDSSLSGYYPAGTYTVKAYSEDVWLAQSAVATKSFDVVLLETDMTVDGMADEITVHIGDEFEVVTSVGAYDVNWVSYVLTDAAGEKVGQIGTYLTNEGGKTSITEGVGTYTLTATAMLTDGTEVFIGETIIHVVNDAPLKPTASAFVDYSKVTSLGSHFGTLGAYTTFSYDTTDPDGDAFTWVFANDPDKYVLKNDYLVDGTYKFWVQAVDEWGAKSEPAEVEFTVEFTNYPYVTPTDVNVHLGEDFAVSVYHADLDVYKMEYKITDSTGYTWIESDLGEYGGLMDITEGRGTYTMRVVAKLQDGSLYEIGTVNINVGNAAPNVSVDLFNVLENHHGDFDVSFDIMHGDPDGDEYVTYYKLDDDIIYHELGDTNTLFLTTEAGEHVLTVYAVDEWGAESKVVEYPFVVGAFLDENIQPEVTFEIKDLFKSGYTTDATRYVDFKVDWMLNGSSVLLDSINSMTYYKVNGKLVQELDGYYALGTYDVEVYAIDNLGTETKHGTCTLVLTNETPEVTLVVENGVVVESVSDDENFLRVERYADGYPIDSYDVLEAGTYELTLTATDIWGAVGTITDTLTIAAGPPVLSIEGHTITDRNVTDHLAYVEFDFVKKHYVPAEYDLFYTVDGKSATGFDGWFTLEQHEISVYAQHKTLSDRVSNVATYVFDLTNRAPNTPVIEAEIDRTDFLDSFTNKASVWTSFHVDATDPDGDAVEIFWLKNGEVVDSVDDYFEIGTHFIEAYAVDVWGLESKVGEYALTISSQAPVVESVTHTANFNVTDTDENGNTMVWVELPTVVTDPDGDKYNVYYETDAGSVSEGFFSVGTHTVMVYAVDAWGKYSDTYEYTFSLTNGAPTAPVVTYQIDTTDVVDAYTSAASALLHLNATSTDPDGDAITIYWQLPDGDKTGEDVDSRITTGEFVVNTWAVDSFGNKSPVTETIISLVNDKPVTDTSWTLDVTKSRNAFTSAARAWVDIVTDVTDKDEYQLYYSLDGGEFTTTNPSTYMRSGVHTLDVYAVDIWGAKSKTESITIDLTNNAPTKPVLSYTEDRSNLVGAFTSEASFMVDVDGVSSDPDGDAYRIYYKIGYGDRSEDISGYWKLGSYNVTAYAVDFWGAQSSTASLVVNLVNTAPTILSTGFSEFTASDIVNPYTVDAYVPVIADASVRDIDGDVYKLDFTMDGKTIPQGEALHLKAGTYSVKVKATDAFGAESKIVDAVVTIGGEAPVIEDVNHTLDSEFQNAYTKDAKRKVTVEPVVTDPDGDLYKVYTLVDGVDTPTASGYYGLGVSNVSLRAIDIWGLASSYYDYSFALTNTKPDKPVIEGVVDWDKVQNPYTTSATVWVDVTESATDPDGDVVKLYSSVNGSAYSTASGFKSGYYAGGSHIIRAYSIDPWGEVSETLNYTFEINSAIDVSINKPGVFGSGFTTSGNTANFTASVTAHTPYKFAWLDFYQSGKPVTVNGRDLTATSQSVSQTTWISGNHMLVVQAMNILGQADYDTFYFQTGVSGTGGSVTITGTGATAGTPSLVENGKVLAYVSGFTAYSPSISGHSSGNSDYLQVIGVTETGAEEQIVKMTSSHALCQVTATNGSGSWTSDGSPSSGTFTYNTNKYVSLKFTFYSPHDSCLTSGGTSLQYTVTYGFANNAETLENMAELFEGT